MLSWNKLPAYILKYIIESRKDIKTIYKDDLTVPVKKDELIVAYTLVMYVPRYTYTIKEWFLAPFITFNI